VRWRPVSLRAGTQQKTFKINPNTAHKVVTHLVAEGVLEVHSGIGTVVAKRACSTAADRSNLLHKETGAADSRSQEVGLTFDDLTSAAARHYGVAFIGRINVSFAALQMNTSLHFSASGPLMTIRSKQWYTNIFAAF
jgi:hypothetical protein